MKVYCNPLNVSYRYQFQTDAMGGGGMQICREAADPSMIRFKGKYYIFASMTLGVWVSDDLAHWESHRLPDSLPLYDYAPDVRVIGDMVYLSTSRRDSNCDRFRTGDILNGPWERIEGTFPFWDPNVFVDDDGRVYFYWGCSNITPIWGVELDRGTMLPIGKEIALVEGHPDAIGYERVGEDNQAAPATEEEIEAKTRAFLAQHAGQGEEVPEALMPIIRGLFSNRPYIEGAWMDKHGGRYYLQYAAPGTEFNTYSDGVYISDHPLGPFVLAESNPYSYKPGGFLPGAGHGSSMRDERGAWWHAATMRISVNHNFERRVGLWPAGFDKDGELFCNQRYGDWPMSVEALRSDPWRDLDWMLLSAGKRATASSAAAGCGPEKATEENIRTWWRAASSKREEWLCVDLGKTFDVRAVQINFADDHLDIPCPVELRPDSMSRFIDPAAHRTQWLLESSLDGNDWTVVEDKTNADTDLSHDLVVREAGFAARYLRLSRIAVPYGLEPCVSGLRVFGLGKGDRPAAPAFAVERTGDLDMEVHLQPQADAVGWNILFGAAPDKLYHGYMVFQAGRKRVGALVKGRGYYVRVDAFNEAGITAGECVPLEGQ